MSIVTRMFSTRREVVNGKVNCPFEDSVAVEQCAWCPWLISMQLRHHGEEAVYCRPWVSSLADVPPA